MKHIKILLFGVILIIGLYSCSNSTNPTGTANVGFKAKLSKNNVTATQTSKSNISGNTVSGVTINRIRILIKELKVHYSGGEEYKINDDYKFDDDMGKSGPFVIDATYPLSGNFADTIFPPGKIKEIEFEISKLDDSRLSLYSNQPAFAPFATSDRYSVIIDGSYTNNGVSYNFTYNSKVEGNVSLEYAKEEDVTSGKNASIILIIDPSIIFKKDGLILDPTDPSNASYIDNHIKDALESDFEND